MQNKKMLITAIMVLCMVSIGIVATADVTSADPDMNIDDEYEDVNDSKSFFEKAEDWATEYPFWATIVSAIVVGIVISIVAVMIRGR